MKLDELIQVRFFDDFPGDNIIPRMFAERLYKGIDPRHLHGDWQSSDRPPLQAGMILLQRPLMNLTHWSGGLQYQILATIIQCSWVPATWSLCRALCLPRRILAMVLAFSIFSGFYLFNSLFVWPKFLAGALTILAVTILVTQIRRGQRPTWLQVILGAIALALGLLAHGGVVFTMPILFVALLVPAYFPGWPRAIAGLALLSLLVAPWSAYQKFYEPPGNRLVKWHLGGVIPIDHRSTWQTIRDSYQKLTFPQVLSHKWDNAKTLLGSWRISRPNWRQLGDRSTFNTWREEEFFYVFKALGILNLGWLLALRPIPARMRRQRYERQFVWLLLGAGLSSSLVWILAMFGPGTTVIHQGSYATMTLLFVGLSILMSRLPQWLAALLLGIHIASFFVIWILTTPNLPAHTLLGAPNFLAILIAVLATVGMVKILSDLAHTGAITGSLNLSRGG
ncbi:hypothetical protein DO97_13335 [Neosynechococcus sphagnicola sy1]|uniref:Glycosyltransferase RgtA/B/C/D-like domain-containing protein n=1 Tax=Neosynechococcus sphagnicola sy1 TaxID=1497020 RepID=A0A098TME5_9CYAN|nr:hypothetical protein DO97_13335 [Neosynechococcus sphagnicola sy1]